MLRDTSKTLAGLADFVAQVRDTAARAPASPRAVVVDAATLRRANMDLCRAFAKDFDYTTHVPGVHPIRRPKTFLLSRSLRAQRVSAAPTYEDILGWLKEGGRDFFADSATLRNRVKLYLLATFEHHPRVVTIDELKRAAAYEIRRVFVMRFEATLRDVRITADAPQTIARKLAAGEDGRVGMQTGALLAAVRQMIVIVTV